MTPQKKEAIRRYREMTKGLSGKDLENTIGKFRSGYFTQDLYPYNK